MLGSSPSVLDRVVELRNQLRTVVADDGHTPDALDELDDTRADWEHQLRWQEPIDLKLYQIVRASCAAPTFFPGRHAQCHLKLTNHFETHVCAGPQGCQHCIAAMSKVFAQALLVSSSAHRRLLLQLLL